jgi:hypothetical protein
VLRASFHLLQGQIIQTTSNKAGQTLDQQVRVMLPRYNNAPRTERQQAHQG